MDFFRLQLDGAMIREIASADYAMDVERHEVALISLWKGEDWDELDIWYPMEVLKLVRWSDREAQDLCGHRMRAFCCAALLITSNFEPDKETLIQLLHSALVLGEAASRAVAEFLTWKIPTLKREEDRPFFVLGLAAICWLTELNLGLDEEKILADWVNAEETSERCYRLGFSRNDESSMPWLFGLSYSDQLNHRWIDLISRLLPEGEAGPLGQLLTEKI